jgi:hypothetical protein
MQGLATFVMRGRGQAILVATLCGLLSLLLPPASYLAGAAVALVTLRAGWLNGLTVLAGTALAIGALGALLRLPPLMLAALALPWVPVWLMAELLRRIRAQGPVLAVSAGVAALAVLLAYALLDSPQAWWRGLLEQAVVPVFQAQEIELPAEVLDRVAQVMSGVLAAATLLGASVSLFIGRWWQALLYNPGGFGAELRALRLDRRLAWVTLGLLALLLAGDGIPRQVAAELLLIALVVYTLQGLAVAHALLGGRPGGRTGLIGLYVALFVLWPYPLLALGAVGLADAWVDVRARVGGPPRPPEKPQDSEVS